MTFSEFPLQKVTDGDFRELCQVLWLWSPCPDCQKGKSCLVPGCPFKRVKRLVRFKEYFKKLAATYEPDVVADEEPALKNHTDLLNIIRGLKVKSGITRVAFAAESFSNHPTLRPPRVDDQERAVNLAVKVVAMVNCSAQRQNSGLLEHGLFQRRWHGDVTFSQFIIDAFPTTDHPSLNEPDASAGLSMKSSLTAKKLKARAGLKFRPTDDLRCHLQLDRRTGTVDIFHHTAFLKEHLRLTKNEPHPLSLDDCLKIGALPRQLALEALDSVQKVLFPLSDQKSHSLLQSLVSTSFFDPDCLRFESVDIRNPDERDIAYHYFGARLADLFEELENPKPHTGIEKWLERKSGARYVMFATLAGVAIAVLLGIAALAVSIYQAYIGYQAWKHPVMPA